MPEKSTSVFGIYPSRSSLEYALSALKIGGVHETAISILLEEHPGIQDRRADTPTKNMTESVKMDPGSQDFTGARVDWLAGSGKVAIPGLRPYLMAGPIVSALMGLGVLGKLSGLAEALIELGMPKEEANRYQERIENGGILLLVHCQTPGCLKESRLLHSTGAENISPAPDASAN